jgi:NTP pyrophosphatase (non-canonical NTP hydrolase)
MTDPNDAYEQACDMVLREIRRAKLKHPGDFRTPHEGYAVMLEEVDELWDEIKKQGGGKDLAAHKEAMQTAAMAIRYMVEIANK